MNLLQFPLKKLNEKTLAYTAVRLTALADKNMIELIIRNLLSNAIKFSYRSSDISISGYKEQDNIRIEVSDNGVGIGDINIKKLLEKHTTITRRGTEKEKGTGLGLLISKEFIEKNGSTLQIQSEPGKGSTFMFSIPAAD